MSQTTRLDLSCSAPRVQGAELRALIVAAARSYLKTPFKHRGRSRRGVDCVGLAFCVAADVGMEPIDHAGYSRIADGATMLVELKRRLREKSAADPKPGDVISLRDYTTTYHVAIVGDYPEGDLSMIHAWSPRRMVVEHRISDQWRQKIAACFEFPGVD